MKFLRNDPDLKQRRRELRANQTDAEMAFWTRVRNKQFHGMRFLRQYSVGPFILDFYCPNMQLAIELDGGQHNEPDGKVYDATRSEYLESLGINVLRFWNTDVMQNIDGVLARREQRVVDRGPGGVMKGGEL
jgi:very-short-patch-repair endonuclease